MNEPDPISDTRLEAALATALGPGADDTAPLSLAVLSRIALETTPRRPPLSEVLVAPLPLTGAFLATLLLAVAIGHIFVSSDMTEAMTMISIFGSGV
jgi:hypothetical protein